MTDILFERKVFNEKGDDSMTARQIVGGNATGITNMNSVKYKWTNDLMKIMLNNHWLPEKVSLVDDRVTLKELTPHELEALKDTVSFLVALDSMQGAMLPRISSYITAPEISAIYSIQEFQELIHSLSYQYLLQELFVSTSERDEIYNRYRENPHLLKRNKMISAIYQEFVEAPTLRNFKRILAADYALEGIYFYSGFNYFYQLAYRNKLPGASKIIKYIENDEVTHVSFFSYQIKEVFDLNDPDDREILVSTLMNACEEEIAWCHETYGNNILGVSRESSEQHMKWLTNQRAKLVKVGVLYKGFTKNPYQYLDGDRRENFFETNVTEYSQATAVEGWSDF